MPGWLVAAAWGWVAGSALLIGALIGWYARLPTKIVASIMAFGSGVLISALSFELMDEAAKSGGLLLPSLGFVLGALVFTLSNVALCRRGAKHRKRSGAQQPTETEHAGSGTAIAIGALLDGIPESMVIGTTLRAGKGVSAVAVAAIFLSNLPEGLSSSAGMRRANRSLFYVFGVWGAIATISGIASALGHIAFGDGNVAFVTAIAAGAILTMLVDTMIPEAFEQAHTLAGLITVVGFVAAFTLSKYLERR